MKARERLEMTNADLFKQTFGIYAEEFWSFDEKQMLDWLNTDVPDINVGDPISRKDAIEAAHKNYDGILDFRSDGKTVAQSFEDILAALPSAQQWIPCSKRLPEEHESIWAKAKGTDRWSESMWEKQSDEVFVTELFEDGTTRTGTACTHDGEWYVRAKIVKRKIVAWMPSPEPWRGVEE